jgi:hypothetical protein
LIESKSVIEALVDGFWPLIAEVNEDEPLSKAVLVYDRGQTTILPPAMGLLSARHEEKLCDSLEDDDLAESLWNPEEFSEYATDELRPNFSEAANKLFDEVNQLCVADRAHEEVVVKSILHACDVMTKKLASNTRSSNVLVYATDPELSDLRTNVNKLRSSNNEIPFDLPTWCV